MQKSVGFSGRGSTTTSSELHFQKELQKCSSGDFSIVSSEMSRKSGLMMEIFLSNLILQSLLNAEVEG